MINCQMQWEAIQGHLIPGQEARGTVDIGVVVSNDCEGFLWVLMTHILEIRWKERFKESQHACLGAPPLCVPVLNIF